MKNKEKKNINKLTIAMLILILLVLIIVSTYTFALYITSKTAEVTAQVAKWDFSADFIHNGVSTTTIDLGSTVNKDTLINGKIAPGTSGSFDVVINAGESETDLKYNVLVENEINKPENLYFKVAGDETIIMTLESALERAGLNTDQVIEYDADVKTISKTIEWYWDYETAVFTTGDDPDENDTKDGTNANNYTFTLSIIGEQVGRQSQEIEYPMIEPENPFGD